MVCDGVTVGRPTCAVPHCMGALATTKEAFCITHRSMEAVCRVVGCSEPVTAGCKTCPDVTHRAAEERYREAGQAAFQLRRRHERTMASAGNIAEDNDEDELDNGNDALFQAP